MAGPTPDPRTWGACPFCGVAVSPGVDHCPICGDPRPLRAPEVATAPRRVRRRLRWTSALRTLAVVAVIVGIGYYTISAVISGPPVAADPLTTSVTYTIPPSTYAVLSGEITGGDYVVGHFDSVSPAGADLALEIFNLSEWSLFSNGSSAVAVYSEAPAPSAQIIYSAPYTDTFYFVFENPYPVTSHLNVTVDVTTQYESNVGDDGFG